MKVLDPYIATMFAATLALYGRLPDETWAHFRAAYAGLGEAELRDGIDATRRARRAAE